MPIAAAGISAGTSLIGGLLGSNAAGNAAAAQQRAGQAAIQNTNQNQTAALGAANNVWSGIQANEQPYQQAGEAALSQLGSSVLSGAPTASQVLAQDPGYQFSLDQANQALQRSQAASGGVGGGGALKAAAQYSQNLSSQLYGQAWDRYMGANQQRYSQLAGIVGIGQNANSLLAGAGDAYANNVSNVDMRTAEMNNQNLTGIGNAQAAGIMGSANAWSGALGGVGNAAMGGYALSRLPNYNQNPNGTQLNDIAPGTGYDSLNAGAPWASGSLPQLDNGSGYQPFSALGTV